MNKQDAARSKKLGALIKDAREYARRSPAECAQVIGVSPKKYEDVENGEHPLSLPDLEALAIYLGVPMGYFWGSDPLDKVLSPADYSNLISLRHRVIGVLLRQMRLKARQTQKELAEATSTDIKVIKEYESGAVAIPFLQLEKLCRQLEASIENFVESDRGPLGRHEGEQRLKKIYNEMPPEMQAFLINPVNVSYLETAYRLSEMDVEKLRQVAENLLDITF